MTTVEIIGLAIAIALVLAVIADPPPRRRGTVEALRSVPLRANKRR